MVIEIQHLFGVLHSGHLQNQGSWLSPLARLDVALLSM